MARKNVAILGSTGSIGRNALEVLTGLREDYRVTLLAARRNIELLERQIAIFRPSHVAVLDDLAGTVLRDRVNGAVRVSVGEEELLELLTEAEIDVVISSFVGFAGLRPTIRAIEMGKTVALANKETLVVAGDIIMPLVEKHNARLIPVDSEHSAILQCLAGESPQNITKLILTASGGPFLNHGIEELEQVSVEDALKHPNWKMGDKITIDSATLMNKGLEVIEAHWLFNLPPEKIEVVIHPQSIIHSMVEFVDGSVKAQLGLPDMKIPIQYALTYPGRMPSLAPRIDFTGLREMTFLKPDLTKFPCLELAYGALATGGTAPAILNAANEIAVEQFLARNIVFADIPKLIREALRELPSRSSPDLTAIVEADALARQFVLERTRQPHYH